MLEALTLTKILDPQGKLKGAASRVEIGIVQVAAVSTALVDPSQLVSSVLNVTPSTCLIMIVYAVMADPPL